MSLRAATPDDLDAVMAIERDSFRGDAWSETLMRSELASAHNHYLVAVEAGRIVGYAGLRAPAGSHDADVQTIALSREARGKGRGRGLLEALLAEAARRGVRQVFLDVRDDNPTAQALYASEGFVEIARRPDYYPDGPTDAIVMRLDVPGWVHAHGAAHSDEGAVLGASAAPDPSPPSTPASTTRPGEWCS